MNQLEELKSILQNEIQNLKTNLMENRAQEGDATIPSTESNKRMIGSSYSNI